jgi:hypothetical protein
MRNKKNAFGNCVLHSNTPFHIDFIVLLAVLSNISCMTDVCLCAVSMRALTTIS